jgi:protein-S-isoprenylcysteine O-methyltransferase Ste14
MSRWLRGERGEWFVVVQFLLFALVAFGPESAPGLPLWSGQMMRIGRPLGLLLGIFGALLIAAGLFNLGSNLTPYPRPKEDAFMVDRGAYAVVRHPIYSGLIIGALGWAMLKGSTLVLLYTVLLFLFFDVKSRKEEEWLAERYSNYGNYQDRVRKLIPFVY